MSVLTTPTLIRGRCVVAGRAEGEAQRVKNDGLACTGLASEGGEAASGLDIEPLDQQE